MKREERGMKKRLFGMIAALLALAVMLPAGAYAAGDAQTSEILISPTFGQTEARSMLDMINAFRTGDEAFYWNQSDTETVSSKGEPLAYSYALEEIAMQRAAEIALSFSHTRPDNTSCFSATASDGTRSWGENIAAGRASAYDTFVQWREDNERYAGQGHRRNMLNPDYSTVGIGHVVLNGVHYWTQEFDYGTDGAPQTPPLDAKRPVTVAVSPECLLSAENLSADPESVSLQTGERVPLPTVSASVALSGAWPSGLRTVEAKPVWTSDNESVCAIDGGEVVGAAPGSAILTGAALGQTVAVSVTVGATPTPAAYAITGASADNGKLYVTLSNPGAATLAAACFDAYGQFLSVSLQSVEANAGTVTLALSADAAAARVMLTDGDFRPLCGCFDVELGKE